MCALNCGVWFVRYASIEAQQSLFKTRLLPGDARKGAGLSTTELVTDSTSIKLFVENIGLERPT